jgi:hypothetical protein
LSEIAIGSHWISLAVRSGSHTLDSGLRVMALMGSGLRVRRKLPLDLPDFTPAAGHGGSDLPELRAASSLQSRASKSELLPGYDSMGRGSFPCLSFSHCLSVSLSLSSHLSFYQTHSLSISLSLCLYSLTLSLFVSWAEERRNNKERRKRKEEGRRLRKERREEEILKKKNNLLCKLLLLFFFSQLID